MLAVVIPTRNRPDLVARAVASVATGVRQDITVVVSENSGPGANREAVAEICKRHGVPMIGPEGDLRMVEHWEWALREVLRHVDPTHVTFLTDRMVYRPQASEYLLRAMRLFPGAISVFNHDRIDDSVARIRIQLQPSTFGVFRTDPRAVLSLAAEGRPAQWVIPRMLNAVVPVEIIHALVKENDRVFGGISPDYYFGYRVLATVDHYMSLDMPLLVHSALNRSTGNSWSTGRMSADATDFIRHEGGLRFETPFPDLITITNAMLHDYAVVARETGSSRFVPIDTGALHAQLRRDVALMAPGAFRDEMASRLARYAGPAVEVESGPAPPTARRTLRGLAYRMVVPRIPVDRLPALLRLPILAMGGDYRTSEAALAAALSLSLPTDPAEQSHWPPGSELCATDEPFEPWSHNSGV